MSGQIAVLVKDTDRQTEALRVSLGLLPTMQMVSLYFLNREIDGDADFFIQGFDHLKEMGGQCYSNHGENVERFDIEFITKKEIGRRLKQASLVIPV